MGSAKAAEVAPATKPSGGGLASIGWLLPLALRVLVVGGPPVALAVWQLWIAVRGNAFGVDFQSQFWPAGQHVLHGESPFPPATREALVGPSFKYPAPVALLMAPFALLPVGVAAALFTAMLVVCALLALYAVGVRDWRCYFTIFAWWSLISALQTANLTLLLALAAALVWRYRNRPALAGSAAGAAIALKFFLWPLVIWLLATRRYAAGLWALAVAVVVTFGSWAALGFAGFADYVPALRILSRLNEPRSYTPLAVALKFGLGLDLARTLGLAIGVAAIAAVVLLGRNRTDATRSFVLALAACILCSPVAWLHYYALFIVALAILRPWYDWLWMLPFFAFGPAAPTGPSWWALGVLPVFTATLALALRATSGKPASLGLTPSPG